MILLPHTVLGMAACRSTSLLLLSTLLTIELCYLWWTSLQPYEWMVGVQYKPMEVAKGDWQAVRRGPPYAIDAWGMGKTQHLLACVFHLSRADKRPSIL